jgi:hypothetical protein
MILGSDAAASQETTTLKARAFSLMHKYIQNNSTNEWAKELMGCTINLVLFEVCFIYQEDGLKLMEISV